MFTVCIPLTFDFYSLRSCSELYWVLSSPVISPLESTTSVVSRCRRAWSERSKTVCWCWRMLMCPRESLKKIAPDASLAISSGHYSRMYEKKFKVFSAQFWLDAISVEIQGSLDKVLLGSFPKWASNRRRVDWKDGRHEHLVFCPLCYLIQTKLDKDIKFCWRPFFGCDCPFCAFFLQLSLHLFSFLLTTCPSLNRI